MCIARYQAHNFPNQVILLKLICHFQTFKGCLTQVRTLSLNMGAAVFIEDRSHFQL